MVMEMIRAGEVREDSDDYRSPLAELFDRLETEKPEHIALSAACTACDRTDFWSHRMQGSQRGSMAAIIQMV